MVSQPSQKVLERIATAWKEDHDRIVEQGSKIVEALRESQSAAPGEGKIDGSVLDAAYKQIDRGYDPKEGGFGTAPKFPRPVTLNFLTRFYARDPKSDAGKHALDMALFTLRKMERAECTINRRRVSSLLGRSLLARAALREDALRPGAARGRLSRRVPNHKG